MRQYEISNATSGHSFGIVSAESESEALDVLAREAGYESHADAMAVLGKAPDDTDLIVTDVTDRVVTVRGQQYDRDAVAALMDDEIREQLHGEVWESEQAFFDAYATAHEAKYGEPFVVN